MTPEVARKPGSLHPFKRLKMLMDKVELIRQEHAIGSFEYNTAIAALPSYTSRGHGGAHRTANRLITGRWNQSRSKYTPHQGKSEIARRLFQAAPAWIRDTVRKGMLLEQESDVAPLAIEFATDEDGFDIVKETA